MLILESRGGTYNSNPKILHSHNTWSPSKYCFLTLKEFCELFERRYGAYIICEDEPTSGTNLAELVDAYVPIRIFSNLNQA